MPPSLKLPVPVDDLAAARKGDLVVLTWTPPSQTTDRENIRHPGKTVICRAIGEYPITRCVDVVKELSQSDLRSAEPDSRNPQVLFEGVLPQNTGNPLQFVTYAIEVLNSRGRNAGLSNQVRVSLAPTLPPPTDLRAEVVASGVELAWTAASRASIANMPRELSFHYRLYRRVAGQQNYTEVEDVPLNAGEIRVHDPSFEWEKTYDYKVVPITEVALKGISPFEIEGNDSPTVRIFVHDTFAPGAPTGLQAVYSGVGQKPFIDLTWAPNMESDLAGYNLFRHEQGQAPQKINSALLKAPSFRDDNVQPGKTYYYSVTAVDLRGNQSQPSGEASESVPSENR